MASKHTFENLLRPPYELAVAIAALGFGVITLTKSNVVALNGLSQMIIAVPFLSLGAYR